MTDRLRIALAQINPHLGALDANADRIRRARADAAAAGADLLVTPEFSVAGYPPEDLVLKPAFIEACEARIAALAAETADGGPGLVIGGPWRDAGRLHNALFVLDGGRIAGRRAKHELPSHSAFNERRVFAPGPVPGPVSFRGVRFGLMIGEDWRTPEVAETLDESGAEILVSINASPFEVASHDLRIQLAVARVVETDLPFVFLSQAGGQDELVFDGSSFVLNRDRSLAVQLPMFEEAVEMTDWVRSPEGWRCSPLPVSPAVPRLEQIYRAMMLGLRDHVQKSRLPGVVLDLSGGIDSALLAAIATDALGADRIRAVTMLGPNPSPESVEDAVACAGMLGIRSEVMRVDPVMEAFAAALRPILTLDLPASLEEALQSRAREALLTVLSGASGALPLTSCNKTALAIGTAFRLGHICGGYSVLKDVYTTTVFELSRWRNTVRPLGALGPAGPVMPKRLITTAPPVTLALSEENQDFLLPPEQLDRILEGLIERASTTDALVAAGHDAAVVSRVSQILDSAERQRRQAPPGVKITACALGFDRRYPLTNGFMGLMQ